MQRLKTRSQFQAVLRTGDVIGRSVHFALHRLQPAEGGLPAGGWIGALVPKRWARQAVTRNLIKRQIYSAGERHAERLADAAHVLRLRSTFDRRQFRSPGSDVLREAVRDELDSLLLKAAS